MRTLQLWSLVLALIPAPGFAASGTQVDDLGTRVQLAETAALAILNFQQGDVASLTDAKAYFTREGWDDFWQSMAGSLDLNSAPTFSSTFTPVGAALDVTQDGDTLSLTLPGVLKHQSRNPNGASASAAYRAEIDVRTTANALKIEMLKQRTCGGAAIMSACR